MAPTATVAPMNEIITFHKPIVENCCRLFLTVARTSERFEVSEKNEELHSSRWRHKGTHTSHSTSP